MKRRKFVTSSAAAASAFMIVPRHVLGGRGFKANYSEVRGLTGSRQNEMKG